MIIAVLGAAGSGKSTQSNLLAEETGFVHISVGQLLRESHQDHLKEYMKIGNLINPTVVNGLLQQKLDDLLSLETTKGILLDGYPRQMAQAEWLIENKDKYQLKLIIVIKAEVKQLTDRLLKRKRIDDNVDAIKKRLKIYKTETEPVIDYLKQQGIFVLEIDGSGDIESTHQKIMEKIKHVITT